MTRLYILVPCKRLDEGKSRLSPCLDAVARRQFCLRLLTRTLRQAAAIVDASRVRLVTCDLDATAIGAFHSIKTIFDRTAELNAALEEARSTLLSENAEIDELLVLPIDLPFVSASALSKMMSCAGDVVIAPDENGTGTNGILLRAPALRKFRFAFGTDSYAAHLVAARAHSLPIETFVDSRLAFDVDVPRQYVAWRFRSSPEELELSSS